ncbi:MAG: sigma-E factor negative regulatory protein [Burkholderiaceae bacterium]
MSTDESADRATELERLSALVDGELDVAGVAQACARWREAGEMRASWHAYQLIGDVLRSDDLAGDPARDAAFLGALRRRLAVEPVVLAPQAASRPLPAASSPASRHFTSNESQAAAGTRLRRWAWMAPSAVAAGFVAVAGVVMLSRAPVMSGVPAPAVATLAPQTPVADATPRLASASTLPHPAASAEPQALVANGKLIRDARLDRYLAAHKQFAGSSALGVPSPFLRSVTVDVSDR